MSLGAGILLIVIGAILTFALNLDVTWIDLHLVGYILMAAGLVIVILGIVLMVRKRSTVVTNRTIDARGREQLSESERRDDPPQY
ncbi:DUF6458 family protein [Leifsonia sp. Root112D2]|uniref:DUF6458 family protein n=1 Tax=Leifsonia sp. Root112D2 TaxID=1736426 RepID=UPI0006F41FC9|nr:DUF6458 family protein [Leifsonia sp. Root112D2]KQV07641.1 hypothetical protein ASC63_10460 [Leifsonia sp. Root112D2]